MKLENAVLITGAAKRLGKAMALALHEQGYSVVIHYSHSDVEAKQLCNDLNQIRKNSALSFCARLDEISEVKALAEFVKSSVSELKVLVNNASQFFPTQVEQATEQDWHRLIDTNVKAPFFLTQQLEALLNVSRGCVVNIVDIYGERPLKLHSIYNMSKAALIMQTRTLAMELAPNVRVNGIAPGAILWPEGGQSNQDKIIEKVALKRQGKEDDIVGAMMYLLNAEYVTGQIIQVDGGRSLNI